MATITWGLSFVRYNLSGLVAIFILILLLPHCGGSSGTFIRDEIVTERVFETLAFDSFGRPFFKKEIHRASFTRKNEYYIVFYNRAKQLRGYTRFEKMPPSRQKIRFYYEFTQKGFRTVGKVLYHSPNSSGSWVFLGAILVVPVVTTTGGFVMDTFANIFQFPAVMVSRLKNKVNPETDRAMESVYFEYDNENRLASYSLLDPEKTSRRLVTVEFLYEKNQTVPEKQKITDWKKNKTTTIPY